jgi:hypothetical protein
VPISSAWEDRAIAAAKRGSLLVAVPHRATNPPYRSIASVVSVIPTKASASTSNPSATMPLSAGTASFAKGTVEVADDRARVGVPSSLLQRVALAVGHTSLSVRPNRR